MNSKRKPVRNAVLPRSKIAYHPAFPLPLEYNRDPNPFISRGWCGGAFLIPGLRSIIHAGMADLRSTRGYQQDVPPGHVFQTMRQYVHIGSLSKNRFPVRATIQILLPVLFPGSDPRRGFPRSKIGYRISKIAYHRAFPLLPNAAMPCHVQIIIDRIGS